MIGMYIYEVMSIFITQLKAVTLVCLCPMSTIRNPVKGYAR